MPEAAANVVTLSEAARSRGKSADALRRLAIKHSDSFVVEKGGKGAGRHTWIDLAKLDAALSGAADELARRKAGILDTAPAALAKRFSEMHAGSELNRLDIKPLSRRDSMQVTAYTWSVCVEALRDQYEKAGIEPPPFTIPDEIGALR